MSLFKRLFPGKRTQPNRAAALADPASTEPSSSSELTTLPPTSPYAAARAEFNEVFGDFMTQSRNWRFVALVSVITTMIAVGSLGVRATQSKFIPYIVEVDKHGTAQTVGLATRVDTSTDDGLVRSYLRRFVMSCRGVSVDPIVAKANVDDCFGMVAQGSSAARRITETFEAKNPLLLGRTQTVEVTVATPLRISSQSWQLAWNEKTRDLTGKLLENRDWKSTVTVAFNPPEDDAHAIVNPLGLFVMDLDWRPELTTQ